ncbi:site-specific integrase [Serratia sp. UGAL515B_01]|uniref:tyrosine-type recombinase/integrase n=1 Tax=Serratia sp. UGAL515B_01 TaxID=2986763 RepID=UPI0029539C6B|nr:site-specific integrase [Serratia sp. UGAL515B_01]WON77532.1 site-specific integrase [Serratia sp. UGAL515B_01]
MALSDTWLRSTLGKEQEKILVKTDRDGLSVRVSLKGKITFQYRYRWGSKSERVDVGTYPAMSLKDARDAAIRLRGEIENNRNPRVVKATERIKAVGALTVQQVIEQWYESYCEKNKKNAGEIKRSFELHVFPKIGAVPHESANFHMWLSLLEQLTVKLPSIADRVLVNAKQAHRWAMRRQLVTNTPLTDLTSKELGVEIGTGERVLSHDEIALLWRCMEESRMTPKNALFIKLCLLFGCRGGELRLARVSDFDMGRKVWTVPPENHKMGTKTGKPLLRPIIPAAEEMIEECRRHNAGTQWLFVNTGKKTMMGKTVALSLPYNVMQFARRKFGIDMPHWSIHDLRRTMRTNLSDLTEPHIAEIMLGHKLPGVWQVYDKSDYLDEQCKAYAKWWARVESIVCGDGKVIEFTHTKSVGKR